MARENFLKAIEFEHAGLDELKNARFVRLIISMTSLMPMEKEFGLKDRRGKAELRIADFANCRNDRYEAIRCRSLNDFHSFELRPGQLGGPRRKN